MSNIHIIIDRFYAAVETELNPVLRNKPFLVSNGSIVIGMSSGYKPANGVKSGVTEVFAREKNPGLLVLRGDIERYRDYSGRIAEALSEIAWSAAEIRPGEYTLDITRCPVEKMGPAELGQVIESRVHLQRRTGQADNRFIAELAARTARLNDLQYIQSGKEQAFIDALPAGKMPYVEYYGQVLKEMSVRTMGDLRKVPLPVMKQIFGSDYSRIANVLAGISPETGSRNKNSLARLWRFLRFKDASVQPEVEIDTAVLSMSMQMQEDSLKTDRIALGLKYADDVSIARRLQIAPTRDEVDLTKAVRYLLGMVWKRRTRLASARLEMSVNHDDGQISFMSNSKRERIASSVETVRKVYGAGAVKYAL